MNWNNTQFDGHAPITIRAARQVGNILNYVGPDYGHLARDGREHVAAFLDSLGADEAAAAAWTLSTMEDSRRRRATTGVAQKRIRRDLARPRRSSRPGLHMMAGNVDRLRRRCGSARDGRLAVELFHLGGRVAATVRPALDTESLSAPFPHLHDGKLS
jgi:hypothetical protein